MAIFWYLDVYTFSDSRTSFDVNFIPLGKGTTGNAATVQDVPVLLKGSSPSELDPKIRSEEGDITLTVATRWDKLCIEWFGDCNRLEDVMNANPQIPLEIKNRLYIPKGTIIHKPKATDNQSTIGAASWRKK